MSRKDATAKKSRGSKTCVHARRSSRSRCTMLVRDQQDRLRCACWCGARAIGSAETIEKWVNRSNVLPAARCVSTEPLSLLSRAARNNSFVGILTLRASLLSPPLSLSFSLSLSSPPPLPFLSPSLLRSPSIFLLLSFILPRTRLSFLIAFACLKKTDRLHLRIMFLRMVCEMCECTNALTHSSGTLM